MIQEDPLELVLSNPANTDSEEQPWKEHGPVALESVSLDEIDDTDKAVPGEVVDKHGNTAPVLLKRIPMRDIDVENETYQFRLGTGYSGLAESIEKDGQHEPIKIMAGEDGYLILDGFCRARALGKLGVEHAHALIYPKLTEREAWRITLDSNLKRKNLTAKDRANAMHRARKEGMTTAEIGKLCGVERRTVQRYLNLPDRILENVDGRLVTVAHGTILLDVHEKMTDEEMGDWADRIRRNKLSAKRLTKYLREADLLPKKRGRERCYCSTKSSEVRTYARKLSKCSRIEDLKKAHAELLAGAAQIGAILESLGGSGDEN